MTPYAAGDIAHIIDLAVAPVFLIAGIGAFLNVLTARLARVVDRVRVLENALAVAPQGEGRDRILVELVGIDRRMSRINIAISLSTMAALLVCLLIMFLFTGQLVRVNLSPVISALFIASMAAMILALCFFLGEVWIATRMLRVREELLERRKRRLRPPSETRSPP